MIYDLRSIANKLLEMSKDVGIDTTEVICSEKQSSNVETLNESLESVERSETIDIGLRVILGGRQVCVSSSDIRESSLRTMVERSLAMVKQIPVDEDISLAKYDQLSKNDDFPDLDLVDKGIMVNTDDLKQWAIEAEVAAKTVQGVTQVQGSSASVALVNSHLAFSNGFIDSHSRSQASISCVSVSGHDDQMERDYNFESRVHINDLPPPSSIGLLSGQRAVARFGASKPPTGNYPVVYDERVSSSLVGHFLNAINGGTIVRGSGWLRDDLGNEVFPKLISIKECPHKVRGLGSRLTDLEGLDTYSKYLVKNGVLETWLLDLSSAKKLGLQSTSNAVRSISSPPSPSFSNISLVGGSKSRADLIKDMGTGLLVTSMIGLTLNPLTGDYSRGASGYWVENGEVKHPVNECTIAGNLKDMLRNMIPANDSKKHLRVSVPSILIQDLKIAGR